MTDKVKKLDFVELDYTGKLTDGSIFDTTSEKVAQDAGINNENAKFGPMTVCVGEKQLLPGLDDELEGKELDKEYEVNLPAEKAFGKRDIKKIKIMPTHAFKEHNMQPQPGLQIDVDGEIGTISRVSGGRVIVNFNHPLAGKEVVYKFKINKIITDKKEKLTLYLENVLRIPKDKQKIKLEEDKAEVTIPFELPEQFLKSLEEKTAQVTGLKEVKLIKEEKK